MAFIDHDRLQECATFRRLVDRIHHYCYLRERSAHWQLTAIFCASHLMRLWRRRDRPCTTRDIVESFEWKYESWWLVETLLESGFLEIDQACRLSTTDLARFPWYIP